MIEKQLDQLTLAWEHWANEPVSATRKIARARLHLLFLLIRFGGLRLSEASSLDLTRDIDLQSGLLAIRGSYERSLLLPLSGMRKIRRILGMTESGREDFLRLDPGFVRRTFYNIAELADMPAELAGPRALRYLRGQELLSLHMPLRLVQDYLGLLREKQLEAFLRFMDHEEATPANTFLGVITEIKTGMRSALIRLKTFSGLLLTAIPDIGAYIRQEPDCGLVARASIAPECIALAQRQPDAGFANILRGTLISIYRDIAESIAVLRLTDNSILHAGVETSTLDGMEPDCEVWAMFKARAVRLELV